MPACCTKWTKTTVTASPTVLKKIKFDGDYKSSLPAQYNTQALPWGTSGGSTIPGSLDLNLPEM